MGGGTMSSWTGPDRREKRRRQDLPIVRVDSLENGAQKLAMKVISRSGHIFWALVLNIVMVAAFAATMRANVNENAANINRLTNAISGLTTVVGNNRHESDNAFVEHLRDSHGRRME